MTDYEIAEAMIVYGGSFVSSLGRLWQLADPVNRGRLKDAFPDYWKNYSDEAMHAALRRSKAAR